MNPFTSIPISVMLNEEASRNVHGKEMELSETPKSSLEFSDILRSSFADSKRPHLQYYGPVSNFTFINQLNHYLRHVKNKVEGDCSLGSLSIEDESKGLERFGMKSTILRNRSTKNYENLLDMTSGKVSKLLVGYLETWSIASPIFTAEEVFNLSIETWQNPAASDHNKAILYLLLSLGAAASYFDLALPSDMLSEQIGFYQLALDAVPNVMSELSVEAVIIFSLMCLTTCTMGDTALSYLYSGHAIRVCLAIGLDKEAMTENLTPDLYLRHRLWICTWQFENYWSFCVGRPTSNSRDIPAPTLNEDAFTFVGFGDTCRFKMTKEHMRIRKEFGATCPQIYFEISNSSNDFVTVMTNVERLSDHLDDVYLKTSHKYLTNSKVDPMECRVMEPTDVREWFWIRIYYLYLKLVIFRPFLVFYAYSKTVQADTVKAKQGADICVDEALNLLNFIIQLNRAVKMHQPIFFICTYVESSCAVLLFYVVSNIEQLPKNLAQRITISLKDTDSFLGNCTGPYIGSIKIMTHMCLSLLNNINQ